MSELFCCSGKGDGYRAQEIHLQTHIGPEFPKEQNMQGKIGPGWYSAQTKAGTFQAPPSYGKNA